MGDIQIQGVNEDDELITFRVTTRTHTHDIELDFSEADELAYELTRILNSIDW